MPGRKSRSKGQRGEREFAKWLEQWIRSDGVEVQAHRAKQHDGGVEEDLRHNCLGLHFEVTRDESIDIGTRALTKKLAQAHRDAKVHTTPVVVWRKSRRPWRVTILVGGYTATIDAAEFMAVQGYSLKEPN